MGFEQTYIQTGDSEAAEKNAKLAYSIAESRFGSADPALTPILNVLAECYALRGRIAEALRVSEQAAAIGPSAGAHNGTALHNFGALREFSGELRAAADFYRRAIDVKIEALGAEHPHVAFSRAALRRVQRGEQLGSINRLSVGKCLDDPFEALPVQVVGGLR